MDDALARSMLRASPDALWLIAPDGSTLYGNARLEALIGRTVEELVALGPASALVVSRKEDLAAHRAHVEELRAHHPGRQNDEVIAERPDGSQVWLMASWAPVHDDDGVLFAYLHRLTEYTERRELLDRLSEREAELESAQAIARLGSWTYDIATDLSTWSPELYRIYGLDPDRFVPTFESYLGRSHPDDRERVRRIIEACVHEGDTYSYESRIVTPTGEHRWLKSHGVVQRDDQGRATVLHGTCQDVSDLHQAGEEAEQARRRLRLFSNIAEAANRSDTLDAALNRAGKALDSVEEWRTLGIWTRPGPAAALTLLYDGTTAEEPTPDAAEAAASASWRTGEVDAHPSRQQGRSVVWLPVSLSGQVVRLIQLEGHVPHVDAGVHTLLNQVGATLGRVAEREHAAVELAAARDDAMAASAHKSAFLATMSHEIRTPMNGVIGLNDLLLRTDLDQHQRRLAEGLRGAGLTLLALINDILDLSKIESGAVELEHAPFEVAQLLDQTSTIISPPAQEKQLELVVSCDPEVPPTLVGDRVRLGQVLTNLASNAVKFTDAGEVVVELGLDPSAEPGTVLLRGEVCDTGIGIGDDAASLFEAFTQADRSTTRSHGGTGLGLTISRRLVQDMGGSIGADELPGGGSRFWFVVPVDLPPQSAAVAPDPRLDGRRALVVDDHPRAAAALARQLTAWGLDVQLADTAEEGLRVLLDSAGTARRFDLALIDLHMPDVDGLTLGAWVAARQEVAQLPLILLSDDPSTRLEVVAGVGFGSIVTKPWRLAELRDAVLGATLDTGELQVAASARQQDRSEHLLSLHVLVVEDNPVNQLVAQGLLEGLGCITTVAHNGEEAVRALAPGHPFDLVLMDCRMPRMDGYVATTLIRARESGTRIPIIAMTASALAGERDRCLAAGMDDFLTKPVDSASLTRLVARWAAIGAGTAASPDEGPQASPPAVTNTLDGPNSSETRAAAATGPVLDPERVTMLRDLVRDGVDFFERTRSSFLSRIDAVLDTLRTARDDEDLARVSSVAHQLKGSALNLGLTRAGAAAAEVERTATSGDPMATATAIDVLERAVSEGVGALTDAGSTHH